MKKVMKKLMAALLAVAMVCAMAIPAFADDTKEDIISHHSYGGFQIFKGDVEGTKGTNTVTYTAHLNDKAAVNITNGPTDNKNSVQLQYSNNPRDSIVYRDHTPESEVYVFTYQLNNTKYHDKAEAGNELKDAGFRLYSDEACNNEIKLKKNDDGTYSRDFSTDATGVEMFSDDKGQFNVKGLDADTYYLKETTTPDGYNTCANTRIVISATHSNYNVTLSTDSNLSTTIINNAGTTLPSTGGIGTTIFYVIGGGLMVAAAILLITKKRMENH